jgi:hypothetical protein
MYHVATFLITNTKTNRQITKKVCCLAEDKDAALFEAYDTFEAMKQDLGKPEWRLQGPAAVTITTHYSNRPGLGARGSL